ncbi:hypothetical protein [Flindersiella endophytica]
MRLLPDQPNLAFLRKEAKDILAALRESEPGVSLAEAQQALAVQYGLRDWTALKAEAERRVAAGPPEPPAGLADALAATFDLGDVTKPAVPISLTPMGRCWSITTDNGRWLAVTVPWTTNAQAEVGVRLRDAAVAAGIAAPRTVRSPRGRLIEIVRDQNWRVHEWIDVGPSPVVATPASVARRAGAIFGTLHSLAIPSQAPIGSYLTERRPDAAWHALANEARAAGKPWAGRLQEILPTLFELSTIESTVDENELILCNRVINPENVRVGHNDELVVTEWDLSGSLTPELEIGWALAHWTLQPALNPKGTAAFRDGYAATAGGWPDLELRSFAIAVTGYLNWTYQTVCAAINSKAADHRAFAEVEAADLLKSPMTRASLERLLAVARR